MTDADELGRADGPMADALDALAVRWAIGRLGGPFYADPDVAADAVRRRSRFNVIDTRSFVKIDVFVPAPGVLGLGRSIVEPKSMRYPVPGPVFVLGPEDTVLQKLRWYELGGGASDRQWRDIVSVLGNTRGRLDDASLDAVASDSGLADLLAKVRADAK
jgi:hypothetical protein